MLLRPFSSLKRLVLYAGRPGRPLAPARKPAKTPDGGPNAKRQEGHQHHTQTCTSLTEGIPPDSVLSV